MKQALRRRFSLVPGVLEVLRTLEKNGLPSTGIPYVVVNGTIVVKDSKVLKGVYPGKPIRNKVLD